MDDYRARFESWKCPIKGELTADGIQAAQDGITLAEMTKLDQINRMFGAPTNYADYFRSVTIPYGELPPELQAVMSTNGSA